MSNDEIEQTSPLKDQQIFNNSLFLKRVLGFSLTILVIGLIGHFIFSDHQIKYLFAHSWALGIIGLFAYSAGYISKKKGRNFKLALISGYLMPVILGIAAVYIVEPPRENGFPSSCGGSLSLGVAIVMVTIYFVLKSKKEKKSV